MIDSRKILPLLILIFLRLGINSIAQTLYLTNKSSLFIGSDGKGLYASGVEMSGLSQLLGVEFLKMNEDGFVKLLSNKARLKTHTLDQYTTVRIPVGVTTETVIELTNLGVRSPFIFGMDELSELGSLPYIWRIGSEETASKASIAFNWSKEVEPLAFDLKALVQRVDTSWELLENQGIDGFMGVLPAFDRFSEGAVEFTVKQFTRDLDEDEVPDIREIQTDTDLKDPGSYQDSDGDRVPDYLENKQGTSPSNPEDFLDENQDGVSDYLAYRSPVAFLDLADVPFPWGTENFLPFFQPTVQVLLGSGKMLDIPVTWNGSLVNVFARGAYPVPGNLGLPSGIFNAYKIDPIVDALVLPKPGPIDISLTNTVFYADVNRFSIPVGAFEVVDPIDAIHSVDLLGPRYDNNFFEIKDGVLFWSSEESGAGKETFKIIVRVTDRDGNVLDKFFEISRNRDGIKIIEVNNTFTPDGDGINDGWGVPEIRFFSGARIQVFERSGLRVFYTEDPDVKWDGTYQGKEMPVGTYYWVLEIKETGESRRGILNLIRK